MFHTILKTYFSCIPDNVVLIDIICHGVGPKKYVDIYRKEISKKNKKKLILHSFRSKQEERKGSQFSQYMYSDNTTNNIDNEKDYYMRLFFGDFILRPSCYKCIYAGNMKYSDITIGDFNGADRLFKVYPDSTKCVSAIIVNTDKGDKFLKSTVFHGFCKIKETTYNFIAEQNLPLLYSSSKPIIRKYIFKVIDRIGFINTSKLLSIKYYVKQLIILIVGKEMFNKIKRKMGRKVIE